MNIMSTILDYITKVFSTDFIKINLNSIDFIKSLESNVPVYFIQINWNDFTDHTLSESLYKYMHVYVCCDSHMPLFVF